MQWVPLLPVVQRRRRRRLRGGPAMHVQEVLLLQVDHQMEKERPGTLRSHTAGGLEKAHTAKKTWS